jgi:hypothetical protein
VVLPDVGGDAPLADGGRPGEYDESAATFGLSHQPPGVEEVAQQPSRNP